MAKITKRPKQERETVSISTKSKVSAEGVRKWWLARSAQERATQLIATAAYLKDAQQYKFRQASIYSRLYGNLPIFGIMGTKLSSQTGMSGNSNLPLDRPTMNVVQSCIDTLVSRLTQSRPRPVFLTDAGDYKERNLAKKLNQFASGELYQTDAYAKMSLMLRDAAVLGTGCLKIYRDQSDRVAVERRLMTEIMVDPNDALYGDPRCLYELKLIDRDVMLSAFPGEASIINQAEQAYPDASGDSAKTVSDQVMVVEAWHLPSGPNAEDGRHMISLTSGSVIDEKFEKECFPFVFLHYSERMLGFFGQPLAEQLMGTQMEINKLLMTISQSINLVGVPRIFVEDGSKVVSAHLNNQIGAIVRYRGTKPQYEVAPCVPQEMYTQLQRLVDYAYQQSGISALSAASKKPAGLDSGAAIREFDDLQSDRFASLNRRYDEVVIDLTHRIMEQAIDIAKDIGSYETVYPNKDGTREIDLPSVPKLLANPFVIQCFDASSLPRDPSGRMAKVAEMIQAGMISIKEGRRLIDFPDLQQNEKLDNASEERIFQALDEIVENGKYTPPDPFMDLSLAVELSVKYYNLYVAAKLEEERAEMLRTFNAQAIALGQAAMAPPPQAGAGQPQAVPLPLPTSPLLPQVAA